MGDHTLLKQAIRQLECALLSTKQTMLTEEMRHEDKNLPPASNDIVSKPNNTPNTQHALVQTNVSTLPPKYVPAAGATYTSATEGELSWRSSLRRPW